MSSRWHRRGSPTCPTAAGAGRLCAGEPHGGWILDGYSLIVDPNGTVLAGPLAREEGGVDFDGWTTGDGGVQVEWVMHRDLVYNFNVGGWVFCDAFSGLSPFSGSSSAWARLYGLVISLAADFTD
jgi:hypothetical protein